jgi:membrane-associated protease RseP (regulator of RpoE activity)
VGTDSPASRSGIQQYTLITSINGTKITSAESIFNISGIQPGTKVRLQGLYRGSHIEYECYAGVSLIEIVKGFPAEEGGLKPGMILISIEGHSNTTRIMNQNDLSRTLSWMMPGDRINVSVYEWEKNRSSYIMRSFAGITLTSKYEYYAKYAPGLNREEYKSVAFLGITSGYMGMIFVDTEDLIRPSAAPFSGAESVTDYFLSGLRFLSLPLLGLSPIDSPVSDLYAPGGVLGSTPSPLFWIAVNSLYWIFWISIMLGLTNALTLFVTDGTPIFKDSLDYLCIRANYNPEKREKLTSSLTAFFSFLVVFLILWQMIGPRIV